MKQSFWLCWTNNCRGKLDSQLYVMHAVTEHGKKTVCGCEIQEIGEEVNAEYQPSCKKCCTIIKKYTYSALLALDENKSNRG